MEPDPTVDLGEQRIVTALADVQTRVDPAATLTEDYRTRPDRLSCRGLHPEPAAGAVASVA
jgi:hypothetical protein